MTNPSEVAPLLAALQPLVSRVRTDVTAVKGAGGPQAWTRQPLTSERLAEHLNGGPARGVSFIQPGQSVTLVGLLDFDSHGGETSWPEMCRVAGDVMETLELLGGSPIAFRSSGGRGIHVYLLWDAPQDAYSVREFLRRGLQACGLRNGTGGLVAKAVEIFPKQSAVPLDGFGNQVILPLCGKSEPLLYCDLAGLVPLGRAGAVGMSWPISAPVPLVAPPERVHVDASTAGCGLDPLMLSALDSLNRNGQDLDYDSWRSVVFAIHHETGGSPEGLSLAHDFSSRSRKHDAAFLDERVWPYIRTGGERGAPSITGRSILSLAAGSGWSAPLDGGAFPVLDARGREIVGVAGGASVGPRLVHPQVPREGRREDSGQRRDERQETAVGHGNDSLSVVEGVGGFEDDGEDLSGIPRHPAGSAAVSASAVPAVEATPPAEAGDDAPADPIDRRGIPLAKHLMTDQANANRLARVFGTQMLVAGGGQWYAWDGRRWARDEADVYRFACRLSELVRDEAREWKRKAGGADVTGEEAKRCVELSESLEKWSVKCEMKATLEAAVGLLRKMLTVPDDTLDGNAWLLNCANGTVDLRTGELRGHDPADYITKITEVPYVAGAACPSWDRVLSQITREDKLPVEKRELAAFLMRWFGYCATGSVREQVFVVHWGDGSNGKSTVLDTIAAVLGEYASTAAPGLLTSSGKERTANDAVGLMGRRMVTAHESGDGAGLREDFIKAITGGDKIAAKFLYKEVFEFAPTHKLQLLTNHKPVIKGSDHGIWRRVLLVPYGAVFGSVADAASGTATAVKDELMARRLRREAAGVLAAVVRGAAVWQAGGLRAPAAVQAAVDTYRNEQDRIGQFLSECCELRLDAWEPLTGGMGGGLYTAYQGWVKEAGGFALSKQRFLQEITKRVLGCRTEDAKTSAAEGKRRIVRIWGVKLLQE